MRKKWMCITLALFLAWSLSSCTKEGEKQTKVLIAVEVEEVQRETLERYIEVSSKVGSKNQIQVVPKIPGTVKKVNVSLGDRVKKGDVLFVIDDQDIRSQVNQAQAALNSAQANYNLSVNGTLTTQVEQLESSVASYELQYEDLMKNLEDMKRLYEAGAVSEAELDKLTVSADALKLQLDTARKSLELTRGSVSSGTREVAQAGIGQAQAGLESARNQLKHTQVRAEIDGVINSIAVSEGMLVSPQMSVMSIADEDELKLRLQVSEEAVQHIEEGTQVYIRIDSISDQDITAVVNSVSKVADPQTLLYPVEINLGSRGGQIKPGMFASVKIVLEKKQSTFAVPIDAVIHKEDESFVYRVDDQNIARKVTVKTGVQNDEVVEILSGLSEGVKIVVKGQDFISDGTEVNVVTPK
ncbi:MAG: efflux RND transporter periplasmic adaptor subunit [Filifactor alocis]|nr:efflux RND transporter periplasmic adaptor subunit [Filifactor alocis]